MSANPQTPATDLVSIEIDGVPLQGRKGAMIIEVADAADIYIPRFCYHKKLPIAANCRMCLVQVENVPKPLPACATPISEGMKVFTCSEFARNAQRGVMEFLLINHPLDCPICDQGGECELQDLALGYGRSVSRFTEKKRVVKDQDIGPLIATEMTRCIHCTRCIRTLEVVAGQRELGGMGRGENTHIGTYIERSIDSEMSGNVIDVCPVGALTSKPFRFRARAWELESHDSIAPHDCLGSNIELHTLRGEVMRVVPRENEGINEVWLSDRDRYSYEGLNSEDRLRVPMIKQGDAWHETDWETALAAIVHKLQSLAADQIGALVSPSATVEEAYLVQKLLRDLGSRNIDHRLRQQDFREQDAAPLLPWLGQSIADLEQLDACLLIGSNVRMDQPIVWHRLRKAAGRGANIMFINSTEYDFNAPLSANIVAPSAAMVQALAAVAKALLEVSSGPAPRGLAALVDGVTVEEVHRTIADKLKVGDRSAVLLGLDALADPAFAEVRALAGAVCELAEASLGYLPDGANAVGAWVAGALPHRAVGGQTETEAGLDAQAMLSTSLGAYLLLGIEPEYDTLLGDAALHALQGAEQVTVMTPFVTPAMREYADVLLPIAPFSETSGTFVNCEGIWQSFAGAVRPVGEARPGWKVLRVLGNLLDLAGYDYSSSEQVRDEVREHSAALSLDNATEWRCPAGLPAAGSGITRLVSFPGYAGDPIVRRAPSLQKTVHAAREQLMAGSALCERLGINAGESVVVSQGDASAALYVVVDDRVPDGCIVVPGGTPAAAVLGAPGHEVTVEKD